MEPRRASAAVQRPGRRHEPRGAAAVAARRGRTVRELARRPPRGQARHHGAVAGERPQRARVRGLRPARPVLHRELVDPPRPVHPRKDVARGRLSARFVLTIVGATRHPHHVVNRTAVVNGVRIDPLLASEIDTTVETFIRCGRPHTVHFVSADPVTTASRDRSYRAVLNAGDLNLPDGMPVALAARVARAHVRRLPGTDCMLRLSDRGRRDRLRHYYFGGGAGVAEGLSVEIRRRYPGVDVCGLEAPPFRPLTDADLDSATERIRGAGTQLLWVGLGSPKQDLVASELARRGAAPVILCVGAAFDFISGTKSRPPVWMQHAGLEWLGRLVSEPRRLWRRYLVGNASFLIGVALRPPVAHEFQVQTERRSQPGL